MVHFQLGGSLDGLGVLTAFMEEEEVMGFFRRWLERRRRTREFVKACEEAFQGVTIFELGCEQCFDGDIPDGKACPRCGIVRRISSFSSPLVDSSSETVVETYSHEFGPSSAQAHTWMKRHD